MTDADNAAQRCAQPASRRAVEVRGKDEILATLDERGELEALPFMPEMLQFCGRRFRVDKLVVKLCDTINDWMYRMDHAVHLAGVRCDGQAHGGCQAGCLIYWKEAWLKRRRRRRRGRARSVVAGPARPGPPRPVATTRKPADPAAPGEEVYACQATELLRAAPEWIPPWDLRQYVLDVRSGNASLGATVRSVLVGAFNEYQDFSRRRLPPRLRIRFGRRFPVIQGQQRKTPRRPWTCNPESWCGSSPSRRSSNAGHQQPQPGHGVRLRDEEVLRPAGTGAAPGGTDHRREDRENAASPEPCIILQDVICTSDYHRLCPRGIYPYWREIWLERV